MDFFCLFIFLYIYPSIHSVTLISIYLSIWLSICIQLALPLLSPCLSLSLLPIRLLLHHIFLSIFSISCSFSRSLTFSPFTLSLALFSFLCLSPYRYISNSSPLVYLRMPKTSNSRDTLARSVPKRKGIKNNQNSIKIPDRLRLWQLLKKRRRRNLK